MQKVIQARQRYNVNSFHAKFGELKIIFDILKIEHGKRGGQ